jgi:hypothetical protein
VKCLSDSFNLFFKYNCYDLIIENYYKSKDLYIGGFEIKDMKILYFFKRKSFLFQLTKFGIVYGCFIKKKEAIRQLLKLDHNYSCGN